MNLRQAAQQALEALKSFEDNTALFRGEFRQEIDALRAALAKPDRKPLSAEDLVKIIDATWDDGFKAGWESHDEFKKVKKGHRR